MTTPTGEPPTPQPPGAAPGVDQRAALGIDRAAGAAALPPSLPARVFARALQQPDGVAMRDKQLGIWRDVTWAEYAASVRLVAHALLALGVRAGDRVAIQSENRPEWLFTDLGTVAIRGITVGLYPTNPAVEVGYLLRDSGARLLVAEDQEQVDKALAVIDDCPDLEHLVVLEPRGVRDYDHPALVQWADFLELGRTHQREHPSALDDAAAQVRPDDVVTLIYTSGTTGPPKGAMLTSANVEFATKVLVSNGGIYHPPPGPSDVVLSYLPLCHVAERAATTWSNAEAGVVVHFAESIDTVTTNLREVQPTLFFAVPRIWEKLKAGIEVRMLAASRLKQANYRVWSSVGRRLADGLIANGGRHTWWTRLLYALGYPFLFRALRDRIGLRRVRAAASGAAPVSPEVLRFFYGMGIVIYEIYGMTENAAVASVNRPGRVLLGTVGEPHDGTELRLDEATGEILTRHPGVFAGYWRRPDATAAALTEDGWLHTGDVGEWVDGTHIRIVDRIKDIIITAGGKNIAPSEIENALKASPFIREAVVFGDRQAYLTALIGIEEDTVGAWARQRRIPYTTYRDLSEKPEVLELVRQIVVATNEQFARVEQVRKFRVLPKQLDHDDGDLTATQKVKRAALAQSFGFLVEDMVRGGTAHAGGDLVGVHSPAAAGGSGSQAGADPVTAA
jgi:long-chain acyl-CoA synthetase